MSEESHPGLTPSGDGEPSTPELPPIVAPAADEPPGAEPESEKDRLSRRSRVAAALKQRARTWLQAPEPVPAPTPPPPIPPPADRPGPLQRMSPFTIGFSGTVGALVAYSLAVMVGQLQPVLMIVVFAFFMALGLNPMVQFFVNRGLRRGLSVLLVTLGLFMAVGLAAWAIVPMLTEQITLLLTNTPTFLNGLRKNETVATLDERFRIIEKVTAMLTSDQLLNNVFGGILGAGLLVANLLFSATIALVLTLYFLASLPQIKEVIYRLSPASHRPRTRYLADEIFRRIGGYLSGMFIVVSLSGTCSFIFCSVLGLGRYALAIAAVTAMMAFIPLVGTNITMILVAIITFSTLTPIHVPWVFGYYLLYQQFEAYFVSPRVMRRSVEVPGVLVVVAALAGGTMLGIVGALLAIPTTAALLLLYREVLIPKLDRS